MYRVALRLSPEQLRDVAAQLYVELLQGRLHPGLRVPLPAARRRRPALCRPAGDVVGARRGRGRDRHRPDAAAGALRARRLRHRRCATTSGAFAARPRKSGRPPRRSPRRAGRCSAPAWRSIRCAPRDPSRSPSCAGLPRASPGRSTSTSPSRRRRCATASPPPARGRSNGWRASACSMRAGSSSMPPTREAGEIAAVARSGAGVVLCPSTEANLGDGLADLPGWLAAGVPLTIGSDSHVTPRLARRAALAGVRPAPGAAAAQRRRRAGGRGGGQRRAPVRPQPSPAAPPPAGQPSWGLVPGARADALVVDRSEDALLGLPPSHTLDALLFSSPGRSWRDVLVAGRWVIRDGVHAEGGSDRRALRGDHACARLSRS